MQKDNSIEDLTEEQLNGGFDQLTPEQRKRILNAGMEGVPSEAILWLIAFVVLILYIILS